MKRDTNAAGQHAEPDRKLVVPPSVRWKKYSVTTRCSNMAGNRSEEHTSELQSQR